MGTSKRKTNEKVKELLKRTISGDIQIDKSSINDYIPQKNISRYTITKEFSLLLTGGLAVQKSISNGDYSELPFDENDINNTTALSLQQIKDKILNMIEDETGEEIEPSLITNSFNNTMTEVILGNITDPIQYLLKFCENFLYYVLMENINEPIIDLFSTNQEIEDFRVKERNEIKKYIQMNFMDNIENFINDKISIEEFINSITRN